MGLIVELVLGAIILLSPALFVGIRYFIKRWKEDGGLKYRENDKYFFIIVSIILFLILAFKFPILFQYFGALLGIGIGGLAIYLFIKYTFKNASGEIVSPKIYLLRLIYIAIVLFSMIFLTSFENFELDIEFMDNPFLYIGFNVFSLLYFLLKLIILGGISLLTAGILNLAFSKELPISLGLLFHIAVVFYSLIIIAVTAIIEVNLYDVIIDFIGSFFYY